MENECTAISRISLSQNSHGLEIRIYMPDYTSIKLIMKGMFNLTINSL